MRLSELKSAIENHTTAAHDKGRGQDWDPEVYVHPATGNLVCAAEGGPTHVDVVAKVPLLKNKPLDQQDQD